jgi:hypothetical protein
LARVGSLFACWTGHIGPGQPVPDRPGQPAGDRQRARSAAEVAEALGLLDPEDERRYDVRVEVVKADDDRRVGREPGGG